MLSNRTTSSNVEINIYGDANNSTIIGIQSKGQSITTSDNLFKKVLFEYLGLPTLREAASKIDLYLAKGKDHIREFDFARSSSLLRLWMAVLQDRYGFASPHTFVLDMYDDRGNLNPREQWEPNEAPLFSGDWTRLKNVQLSAFVNRAPGKFFLGGWRFSRGHEEAEEDRIALSERMWTWEDYAVRTLGIGDVRLGPLDGFTLLQASSPLGAVTSFSDVGGAKLSPLGFPLLVEDRLFKKLKPIIDFYGAAFVEEIAAQLVPVPTETGLVWAPGVPKTCLLAVDRSSMSAPAEAQKCYNSIWTVAANRDQTKFHYCVWGFESGTKGYRANMKAAADTIGEAMRKRNLHALFECDHDQNWFSEGAEFGPDQIKFLSKKISKQERLQKEISLNDIDASAEHFVADMVRESRSDPDAMQKLSRAWQLFQMGSVMESLDIADRFLSENSGNPFAFYLKAVDHFYLSEIDAANGAAQRAFSANPSWELRERIEHLMELIGKGS
ncbi:hypothetical protein CCP2SC5_330001 [Azospirillaceae bacterium]